MPKNDVSNFSPAAKYYFSKLKKQFGDELTPIQRDLLVKAVEQWETYRTANDLLQKCLDETGSLNIVQANGVVKLNPMFAVSQNSLAAYLKLIEKLKLTTNEKIEELDEVDSFLGG